MSASRTPASDAGRAPRERLGVGHDQRAAGLDPRGDLVREVGVERVGPGQPEVRAAASRGRLRAQARVGVEAEGAAGCLPSSE